MATGPYNKAVANTFHGHMEYSFQCSISGGALTVSMFDNDGNAFSDYNPLSMYFEAPSTGVQTIRYFINNPSITVPSGGALGIGANLQPCRVHLVLFDDAGTARIGVYTTCDYVFAAHQTIGSLADAGTASSTTISNSSNSLGTFYTNSGVASKNYRYIGFIDFDPAFGSAIGTWDTAPSAIRIASPGIKMPGDILQTQRNHFGSSLTGTSTIPYNNSLVTRTSMDLVSSLNITPIYKQSVIRVSAAVNLADSAGSSLFASISRSAETNIRALAASYAGVAGDMVTIPITYASNEHTVSTITWELRVAVAAGGTHTVNGSGGVQQWAGASFSWIQAEEIST